MAAISTTIQCGRCGSSKLRRFGFRILSDRRMQQYQCKVCGKVFCAGASEPMDGPEPESSSPVVNG